MDRHECQSDGRTEGRTVQRESREVVSVVSDGRGDGRTPAQTRVTFGGVRRQSGWTAASFDRAGGGIDGRTVEPTSRRTVGRTVGQTDVRADNGRQVVRTDTRTDSTRKVGPTCARSSFSFSFSFSFFFFLSQRCSCRGVFVHVS